MKTEDKLSDKKLELFSDESKEIRRHFPSDFSIGGPFSAFSGIGTSVNSGNGFKHELLPHRVSSPSLRSTLSRPVFSGPSIFNRQLPVSTSELPIAPAFAQIFQRRRRRENRPRRQRTTFTSEQTLKLELEYNRADYITRPRRFELAEMLSLSESQIKIWFQNRRAKDKRIEKAHMDHQLRTMGYNNVPGLLPVPFPCPSMCGTCAIPPASLPVSSGTLLFRPESPKALKML